MNITKQGIFASTFASVITVFIALLGLFWTLFLFIYGGPDGKIGNTASIVAIIPIIISATFSYAAYLLFKAPRALNTGDISIKYKLAYKAAPFLGILSIVLMYLAHSYTVLITAIIVGTIIASIRLFRF